MIIYLDISHYFALFAAFFDAGRFSISLSLPTISRLLGLMLI